MELVVILMSICLFFAAFRQHKLAKKINQLEDKLIKIMDKDMKKWKD